MKKIISLLLALTLCVGCVAALSSCGAPEDSGAKIEVYLGSEVMDFDPSDYYVDSNAEQIMSLLFEPLFKINSKGKLQMAAADSYVIDEEKRTIVIELRESYWSDDVRVKAADFVFAWGERLLNPNNPNPAAALLYDIENAAAVKSGSGTVSDIAIKATDIYEITITYRNGADVDRLLRNLASVATAPIRQDICDTAPGYWSKYVDTMVFNGPFKIRSYDPTVGELSVSRNLGYHQLPSIQDYDDNVTPDSLVGFVTPAGSEIKLTYSDIENKTVFYLADAPMADRVANKDKANVYDDTSVYTYVFNTENPLFAFKEVRLALSLVIDREAIVSAIAFGKAANGFIPDAFGGSTEALISTTADKARAETLLASVDLSGVSKSFSITVDGSAESLAVADIVKAAWEDLGFNVKVETAEKYVNKVSSLGMEFIDSGVQVLAKDASFGKRDFDVLALDWQTYTADPFVGLAAFSSSLSGLGVDFSTGISRGNISGWINSDYDYMIGSALKAKGDERAELLASAEALLCAESPVIPLYFNQTFNFSSKDLSGITVDYFGNISFTKVEQKNYRDYLKDED